MSLLGKGALVIWHDIATGCESDYEEWHSKEHMLERVAIRGFLRGHRGLAICGAPQYINWYEVEDLTILTSPPYLERLNAPTPWTQKALGYFRGNNRTLCRVVRSVGNGLGGHLLSLQLAAAPPRGADLGNWLDETVPTLVERPGIISAHYLAGDLAASRLETEEKRLRAGADAVSDRVVLVGGYDADALQALRESVLASENLTAHGASAAQTYAVYRLLHSVSKADL